jgi:hypothetical protein
MLGMDIYKAIDEAIDSSKAILLLVGPTSVGTWQQEEWSAFVRAAATNPNKLLIPVILPGGSFENVPGLFKKYNALDLSEGLENNRNLNLLLRTLKA